MSNGLFETLEGAVEFAKTGKLTEVEERSLEEAEETYQEKYAEQQPTSFEGKVKSAEEEYYESMEGEPTSERKEIPKEDKGMRQVKLGEDTVGTVCHVSMTSRLPEWAQKEHELTPEEAQEKIPICFITKDDIRKFGLMVLGNDGTEGLNEKQYERVRKGIDLYMSGAIKRVGKNEWVVFSNKTYVIGWRNGEYVHLDNHGGDWWYNQPKEAVHRKERLWCKHIIAVHIARKLDCDIDLQEEWGSFKELQNRGV